MLEILLPECRRLFGIKARNSQEKYAAEQEIEAFLELRKKLPKRVQALTGYEIAALGGARGMSGFHFGFDSKSYLPFQMVGWSSFGHYLRDQIELSWGGIAFRIERACFDKRSPVWFFEADSTILYPDDDEGEFIQKLYENSSGITDLKVVRNRERRYGETCRLEFRLTDKPQNRMIELQGDQVNSGQIGGYVIQIPLIGILVLQQPTSYFITLMRSKN